MSITNKLEELASLFERGLLTKAEYDAAKEIVLDNRDDKIRELEDLRDRGILSDTEFEKTKEVINQSPREAANKIPTEYVDQSPRNAVDLDDSQRPTRPAGFRTMVILGYIACGVSFIVTPFVMANYIQEGGYPLSIALSISDIIIVIATFIALYLTAEQKSIAGLNWLRVLNWFTLILIPISILGTYSEDNDISGLVVLLIVIPIQIFVAAYWQRIAHMSYLESFKRS